MKRIISVILSIFILIAPLSTCAFATEELSGSCGADLSWSYDPETKALTIEGSGSMDNWYSNRKVPFKHLRKEATALYLPEGLTSVGDYAFYGFENISQLTIPSTVKTIGNGAFSIWKSLKEVHIPEGVVSLGGWVFASCTSLEEVTFPSTLTTINYECFLNCPRLMDVTIPSTLTSLGRLSLGILASHAYNYDMIIRGVPGSNAQTYASTYLLRFVSVYADAASASEITRTLSGYEVTEFTLEEMDFNGDGTVSVKDSLTHKLAMAS